MIRYLGSIGVLAGVGHAQNSRSSVAKLKVLISKLGSKDRFTTSSVAIGKVTLSEIKGQHKYNISIVLPDYFNVPLLFCLSGPRSSYTYSLDHEVLSEAKSKNSTQMFSKI